MTDEEFEEMFENLSNEEIDEAALEEEIAKRLLDFEDDYDLSDMKINDRIVLRNLIISMISLEALEKQFVGQRENLSDANILLLDRTSGVMSKLRHDISDMQNDLKLTRKIRKEGREESFMSWLEKTREKAEKFYKRKHLYIFCPECRRLEATVWLLYPDEITTMSFHCGNEKCRHEYTVYLPDLYETDNKNLEDVVIP
jgi:hypothetical protein